MSNPENERWRELAELLGLPADEPPPGTPTATAHAAPVPDPAAVHVISPTKSAPTEATDASEPEGADDHGPEGYLKNYR